MKRIEFIMWAGKQGWKYGQPVLNKVWDDAIKGGNIILENHFPKLLSRAQSLSKTVPDKVTKIPTKFKTPPPSIGHNQPPRVPLYRDPTAQEGMIFFRDLGTKMKGHYGPFGQGTDGFRNAMMWLGQNSPREIMKVMKQYGYKPKVVPKKPPGKAQGGIASLKEGGPSQKDIDKGIAAIEKLKSSLMPESYEELIEIYKDKQKDLNIDIMEDAGGLGEMLGEGGRIGFADGTTMDLKYINPGFDKSEGMASGMGGFPLPAAIAGTGIFALSQKDKGKKTPQKKEGPNFPEPPEDKEPSILSELARGEILQNLYKNVKGLQHGAIERKLREKYGKGFEAHDKAMNEATEIVNQKKLKIVADKMNEVNIGSDAYVDLIDEHIRLTDREMYKDLKRWKNTRPDLADKTRTLFFPDWAEAQYGEDYQGALNNRQAATLREKSDEIDKMYPDTDGGIQGLVDEIDDMNKANIDEIIGGRKKNASGGRIGMMYGGDPGFAFSYGGSWADWKENHASEMPVMDYINQKLPKARNPFSDSSYQDGGPVMSAEEFAQSIFQKPYDQLTPAQQQAINEFTSGKAEGGRIGLGSGTSPKIIENRKRNLYFDLGRDDFMNMFEYLQSGLSQNDYDGKYKKGGRVGFKKGGKGGIGDLMSEMYRLFEIAPLLATPELMDLIQKVPFDKGGKVKKGKGPNMSRRSFLQLMGGLASLPVVGKYFKLAKTKPVKDISVKLKSWIDDSDEMTEYGPQAVGRWAGNFDISSLTPQGVNILKNLFGKSVKTVKDKTGKITASMDDVATDDAAMYVDDIIKKGKGVIDFKYVDDIVGGTGSVDAKLASYAQTFGKNSKIYKDFLKRSKKMTEKQKIKYELDGSDDPYVDDVLDLVYPGKAEGGIIEDDEFREFLEDRKNRDKDNFQRDFFEDFKKWKKWKKWKEGNIIEAKDGGRMWRPKSAPQLTTTIPPESGPMPQGLTYLTGDDIVQNIGYKHGRN